MAGRARVILAACAALLVVSATGQAYERELKPRDIREAYFLGKNERRWEEFNRDYVRALPLPRQGVHIERIEISTPYRQMAERARRALDGYSPVTAEAEYKEQAPLPVFVRIRLRLTPTYPAHSPITLPLHFGPIYVRDPNFWLGFNYKVEQRGEVAPLFLQGEPFYFCGDGVGFTTFALPGTCWLAGADVMLVYAPDALASAPTRILVLTPDGQRVEAEFDLDRLR
ncbi:MAG: hypothetical protein HYY26_03290 [Acidobacteria bacterium]|nr:hypothetical protein [Acidobacteriota bacterium]